jgi:hypothetical protein
MTVKELIEELKEYDENFEVELSMNFYAQMRRSIRVKIDSTYIDQENKIIIISSY